MRETAVTTAPDQTPAVPAVPAGVTRSPLLDRHGAVEGEGPDAGVAAHYGDPMREQRLLAEGLAVVDLSHRGVVTVTGPDRLSWLHSITTQMLTGLAPRQSRESLVLSPKGHIEHDLHLVDDGETLWITTEPGSAGPLVAWLNSMRFMLRVECDPVKGEGLLTDLFAVRHDLQTIRTTAAQTRELLALAADTSVPGFGGDLEDLRHGFEHLTNTADLEREYLQEVLDLFQTRTSTELNRFIRKITAWGAIGVAGTLIAGIYGMNFAHMPELGWQLGYPMALGMILTVGVVLYVLFRRHGWL